MRPKRNTRGHSVKATPQKDAQTSSKSASSKHRGAQQRDPKKPPALPPTPEPSSNSASASATPEAPEVLEHESEVTGHPEKPTLLVNCKNESVKLNIQLPLRHVFTFPFLGVQSMVGEAFKMGIEKAEKRKAERTMQEAMQEYAVIHHRACSENNLQQSYRHEGTAMLDEPEDHRCTDEFEDGMGPHRKTVRFTVYDETMPTQTDLDTNTHQRLRSGIDTRLPTPNSQSPTPRPRPHHSGMSDSAGTIRDVVMHDVDENPEEKPIERRPRKRAPGDPRRSYFGSAYDLR
ncbi:hypothetical protein IQ07DRAFT_125553 [Pyrenochaeta sp. DS3sAY3a]|nr:hypothetical protein IQ07DRAFT_125553 [Pyrenochaeta sp. DS3sAY3a]